MSILYSNETLTRKGLTNNFVQLSIFGIPPEESEVLFPEADLSKSNSSDDIFNTKRPQIRSVRAFEVYDPKTYELLGLFKDAQKALNFAIEGGEK